MNTKPECGIKVRKSDKQNNCSVPGIHLKVKKNLEIVKDGIVDIVRFINDDHRRFPLFNGQACDFFLDDLEITWFLECRLGAKL